jgi:hypothetical protein
MRIPLFLGLLCLTACSKSGGDGDDDVSLSGQIALTTDPTALAVVCVTLGESAQVARQGLDASGRFAVAVPQGEPLDRHLEDGATGSAVASIAHSRDGIAALGGTGTIAVALDDCADLGTVAPGQDGVVVVPAAALAGKRAADAPTFETRTLHDKEFTMTCAGPDAATEERCRTELLGGAAERVVYFRIVHGQEAGGAAVVGKGVWASRALFQACGGLDFPATALAAFAAAGITFETVAAGAFAYGASCPESTSLAAGSQSDTTGNIDGYHAFSRLVPNAAGYALRDARTRTATTAACTVDSSLAFEVTGAPALLHGVFHQVEVRRGCGAADGRDVAAHRVTWKLR